MSSLCENSNLLWTLETLRTRLTIMYSGSHLMETQTKNILFKITFLKERRNEILPLFRTPPYPYAIWIYLIQKRYLLTAKKKKERKVNLCFKKPLQRRIWNNYLAAHNDSSVRQLAIPTQASSHLNSADNARLKKVP